MGFHVVKRDGVPTWKKWLIRILSLVLGLLVSALITVLVADIDPIKVFENMINGAFGTERRIWSLFQGVAMLLCVALALTPAFKMRFWNIGGEGQGLIGGLASLTCMLFLTDKLPNAVLIIVMLIASMLGGAFWAVIPAYFKARWGTNETLFTLMMNYIAIQLVNFFVYKWANPAGSGKISVVNPNSHEGWLPVVANKMYLLNILIVLALTIFMYVYLKYSKHGYEIEVVGESENTAKYIGIDVKHVIIRTMLLSGALCGLAGFLLVSGTDHTLTRDTLDGRGFTAIMVSWLAKFNPITMILTAFILIFFSKGGSEISSKLGLNDSFSDILMCIVIMFIIGSEFFINYKIKRNEKEG